MQQPAIAIVGSRNASAAGLAFADRLARGLGQAGYVVVSGLARGIDLRAHVAALETGTVGVLAGGHAQASIRPRPCPIAPRIAEHGAVVSEMPIEWEPRGRDFPRRNRIVSGMALGTVVVEAARGSGSLITAQIRRRAEPRGVRRAGLAARSARRRGQRPVARGREDLRAGRRRARRARSACGRRTRSRSSARIPPTPASRFGANCRCSGWTRRWRRARGRRRRSTKRSERPFAPSAEDALAEVERLLGPSPISLDELAEVAGLPIREVRVAVMTLDLAGRIEHSGGGCVALLVGEG